MKIRLVMARAAVAAIVSVYAHPNEALKVRNASEAMNVALFYLREQNSQIVPTAGIQWKEKTIYSGGPVDLVTTSIQFTSDAWIIEVSQGLAPLRNIVYQVTVFSTEMGWFWKGKITADCSVHEESAFKKLSDEEKQRMTDEFLRKSRIPAPIGGYGH
jgi:hypothetical protein